MSDHEFAIDDDGRVWMVNGRMKLLGHIQYLDTRTAAGIEARDWWQSVLEADAPIPRVEKVGKQYRLVKVQ